MESSSAKPLVQRRPRAPGVVYLALALVLAVVVGALTLTARQPPPPSIAEFAPNAVQQIKDAPSDQTGSSGFGQELFAPPARSEEEAKKALAAIDVPRVKKCVGEPPRQIEDPQSPPCIPYWDGDNGGATWKGVTGDEIRIVIPNTVSNDKNPNLNRWQLDFQGFFNTRFQFYGRKLVFKKLLQRGAACPDFSAAGLRAEAVRVDEEYKAFASTSGCPGEGTTQIYYDELARREIISANAMATYFGEERYAEFDPYQWNFLPTLDVMGSQTADWMCRGLAGKLPRYSPSQVGRQAATTGKRVFGLLIGTRPARPTPEVQALEQGLARCGESFKVKRNLDPEATSANNQAAFVDLQRDGVSTVLCLCNALALAAFMGGASAQSYFPEWFVTSFGEQDQDFWGNTWPPSQSSQAFGITFRNRNHTLDKMPWAWAIREVDPTFPFGSYGEQNSTEPADYYMEYGSVYSGLLLLASGIQMAGPNLTPATFKAGLARTRFPNPGAAGPPYYQARVGFGPNSHTMAKDGAIIWYSSKDKSYDGATGTFCYLNNGQRYEAGTYPATDEGLFLSNCRS